LGNYLLQRFIGIGILFTILIPALILPVRRRKDMRKSATMP